MRKLLAVLLLALAAASPARAAYTQAELDQMLAPVALYPDALLSQVLMASTYPLDVVEAARWTRAHPGLQGDEAVSRVAGEDWDPSVKSLVAFPDLLQRMDGRLEWTRGLGEAFLEQEPHVMETVQRLRRRAESAGHLLPDGRLRALADGDTIVIEQADPRVVVVPYYDPWVVYGAWGWPAYPPVAWSSWSTVVVGVSAGFFFGGIDWHHRHVKVVHAHSHYVRHRPIHVGKWHHVPKPRHQFRRHDDRPRHYAPQARPMPPAFRASPQPQRIERPRLIERPRPLERPRETARAPRESPRIIERHDRGRVAVDPAHRVGRVRPDAAQHRAAQPHRFARDARRDARQVPVRPAVRAGMAGDRPRMAR
jgi:hypothetical protein